MTSLIVSWTVARKSLEASRGREAKGRKEAQASSWRSEVCLEKATGTTRCQPAHEVRIHLGHLIVVNLSDYHSGRITL